jgi:TfoX/Sxy family transcriptional regulator of competence genes
MPFDATLATRVRRILDVQPGFAEKHMFGGVCFMVRGHMACGIVDTSLMVRLDPTDADALADTPHVRPMDFTGRPMRGFLYVDAEGLGTAKELRAWVERCVRFVEAKPAKRVAKARRAAKSPKRR